MRRRAWAIAVGSVGLVGLVASPALASDALPTHWPSGSVLLVRHARAPGVGDPAGFRLGDCGTQRNLDDTGRTQARGLGERLRALNVPIGAVWTSQWCRTRDTAELAFPGRWIDQPDFNSFFADPDRASAQTAAALERLRSWRGPGVLVVVTHQVNISALTGRFVTSGEALLIDLPEGQPRLLGRLTS